MFLLLYPHDIEHKTNAIKRNLSNLMCTRCDVEKQKLFIKLKKKRNTSRGAATTRMKAKRSEMHSCQGVIYFFIIL